MSLFGTWEMDRSSPSCVPRLCSLTLKKLLVLRELDRELSSIVIAVKLQGCKRTLRSHEYFLPLDGQMETDLELSFSLQYPHFLKRDSNCLYVMLQRKRRYKNRTIRGYKTLAVGVINMSEVMQHPSHGDTVLSLHMNFKDVSVKGAELSIHSLSSQPIEQEDTSNHHSSKAKASDRSPDRESWWDEDDDSFSSEQEGSDDAVTAQNVYGDDDEGRRKTHPPHRKIIRTASLTQQPKFKQKFVALLKRFKVTDEALSSDPVCQSQEAEEDLDLLYDSLEVYNRSESERDLEDSDSIQSTPKPTLRPFFEGTPQSNIANDDGQKSRQTEGQMAVSDLLSAGGLGARVHEEPSGEGLGPADDGKDGAATPDANQTTKLSKTESLTHISLSMSAKERQNSKGTDRTSSVESETSIDCRCVLQVVRKSVLDQLNNILFSDDHLPDSIILINTTDWQGQYLSEVLFDQPIVCTVSAADVQAAFAAVLSRIQRYCNCSSQAPPPVKVVVGGDQAYLSSVLCCFVEQLASKTPDWLNYIRFLILPVGVHPLARYVSSLDARFGSLFTDAGWRELFSRHEPPHKEGVDVARRVSQYLSGAAVTHLCPISEAMLTYKHRSREEDSCQTFVPFIGLVKVGVVEHTSITTSVDSDDFTLGSPPSQAGAPISASTPPTSPSISCPAEVMCLQLDYWSHQGGGGGDRRREAGVKNTLKSNFRCLQVSRLSRGDLMSMTVVTKEKNKKVMFLSKKMKEKDAESRSQVIEGISRLICTSKHHHTLRVCVDGVEHSDVKFFQLSAQWPTHVKHFPVGIFSYSKA
ncbi:phosphofurin acidic cluster sorting protein 1-like [Salarias fasciatus]|nr:phosphofurin acidic cluster sorting protein 1-like [Salarias fasciatus]